MRRVLATALLVLASLAGAAAQDAGPGAEARALMNEGARQYRGGNFIEAQRLFEQALALDPQHKFLPVFIARAIHQQYRPGVDTPENRAKAEEAVAAYRRALERDPRNEDPEGGDVAEAEAVEGHELLREAAAEAVRRWKFSETRLSGRPVKVRGVVLINFNLSGGPPR